MRVHAGEGLTAAGVTVEDLIPAEVHGFAVRVGIGPYPPDSPNTHRRAMYAELTPISSLARDRMRRQGRAKILATSPLTQQAAAQVAADPQGKLAEMVGIQTLAQASRLARDVTA